MSEDELRAMIVHAIFGEGVVLADLLEAVEDSPWFDQPINIELVEGDVPSVQANDPPSGSRFDPGADVTFTFTTTRHDLTHTAKIFDTASPDVQVGNDGAVTVNADGTGTCTFASPGTVAGKDYFVEFKFDGMFPQVVYLFNTHPETILERFVRLVGVVFNAVGVVLRWLFRPLLSPRRAPKVPRRVRE